MNDSHSIESILQLEAPQIRSLCACHLTTRVTLFLTGEALAESAVYDAVNEAAATLAGFFDTDYFGTFFSGLQGWGDASRRAQEVGKRSGNG